MSCDIATGRAGQAFISNLPWKGSSRLFLGARVSSVRNSQPVRVRLPCRRQEVLRVTISSNTKQTGREDKLERENVLVEKDVSNRRWSKLGIAAAYAGFAIYVLFLAPGSLGDLGQIGNILNGNFEETNDIFFAVFNLFGASTLTYAALLNSGASKQSKLSTEFFSTGGIFLGFWSLGPYLFGRDYVTTVAAEDVQERGFLSRTLDSRALGIYTLLYTLWAYAFGFGLFTPGSEQFHDVVFYASWVNLTRILQSDKAACSTCLDYLILSAAVWGPLTEDMKRRGWFEKGKELESVMSAVAFMMVPTLGPALYISLRPPLPTRDVLKRKQELGSP